MKIKEKIIKTLVAIGMEKAEKVKVYSDEAMEYSGKDIGKAVDACTSVESAGLNFFVGDKCIGWIGVMPFESKTDMIYDYTDNDFTNGIMEDKRVKKLIGE